MLSHEIVIKRSIELARLGLGHVSPNPIVGSVIVCKGKIIGEGYHKRYGTEHAEVHAIQYVIKKYNNAEELLKQSTLYVTLEPCSHFGKTPPCCDLIIKHQIPTVVVGCRDPFDAVNGRGIEKLRNAGIEVITGVLEEECIDLNKRFFTRVSKQRPYIILKWAETANSYFAPDNGTQQWITGKEAQLLSHQWRTQEDCVLVGKRTAEIDDSQLNVRLSDGRNPKRAVIDRDLKLSKQLHLFDNSIETFVFNASKTDIEGKVKYIGIEDFDNFLPQYILFQLYLQDVQSLIIEGGVKTLQLFIDAGLWDEARIFISPDEWASGIKSPNITGKQTDLIKVGRDHLSILVNTR